MEQTLEDIRQGKFIILVDDERENEGDIVIAAEKATQESIAFMLNNARGFVCIALPESRLKELNIPQMVQDNTDVFSTPFTVTVGAKTKTSGVSAADRLEVIKVLLDPKTKPDDLARPGHVLPLAAKEGGLLERVGHTEASVDLARIAGIKPAALVCEILNEDGTVSSKDELIEFTKKFGIRMVSLREILDYRRAHEKLVSIDAEAFLPTAQGNFKVRVYRAQGDSNEHVALVKGDTRGKTVLTRIHSECLTGDVFASARCDCWTQMNASLAKLSAEENGVFVYLRQEGRGIGLLNKIKAYALQDKGFDTVEANLSMGFKEDHRDYWIAAQILKDIGVSAVRLLTNNQEKINDLERYGVPVAERVPLRVEPTPHTAEYLKVKKIKLKHML